MPTRQTATRRGEGNVKPGDHTARINQAKAEEALKAEEAREQELTMARAAEREASNEVIDATEPTTPQVVPVDEVSVIYDEQAMSDAELVEQLRGEDDPRIQKLISRFAQIKAREEQDVASVGMVVSEDYWVIRTLADVNRMTYGNDGQEYNFKRGQRYKVTPEIGGHLKRLGLLMNA